jgi:heme/copper-type cytochrome/quinol oxidase subunit 1
MDPFVRHFIRASLLWLGFGVLLGVAMAVWPGAAIYRPAHMHANLLGFVSMMIFGVAYHVMPRFAGRPLHSSALAAAHVWLANGGLVLLVAGWLLQPHVASARLVLGIGAVAAATGAFAFIYNIWQTLDAAAMPVTIKPALRAQPGGRQ